MCIYKRTLIFYTMLTVVEVLCVICGFVAGIGASKSWSQQHLFMYFTSLIPLILMLSYCHAYYNEYLYNVGIHEYDIVNPPKACNPHAEWSMSESFWLFFNDHRAEDCKTYHAKMNELV